MRTITKLSGIILLVLLMTSCGGGIKRSLLPTATGQPYEVMVVMNAEAYQRAAGRELFNILNADVPGLPQSEPLMKISSVAPNGFESFLKLIRNVLIVDISNEYSTPRYTVKHDEWADQQIVVYVTAPSEASLEHFLQQPENAEKLINCFYNAELNRAARYYQKNFNSAASATLADMFGISINIPDFMTSSKVGKNFFWITDNSASSMNIIVYAIPYTQKDAFTQESLIHVRDSVLKENVPGGLEGSYMKTSKMPTLYRTLAVNNKFCVEMRGLWDMQNDMMGGPFVSLTRLDEANNRIITAEAFVFAPSKEKRNLIKRAEAALYTLKLPGEVALPEVTIEVGKQAGEQQ